ncbi:MAG: hypothetical protein M3Q77_07210 [Thermoproteota archaeon]|nr:hypothetical protein [Nitrosopumilus sp.]MDQ3084589.1 hypothetical protein [Thermoproteota archaeon]
MNEFGKEKNNNYPTTLPNSVRINDQPSIWTGFHEYLIRRGQRKHSIPNKLGHAK